MNSVQNHEENILRYREIYKKMYNDTSFDEFKRLPVSAKAQLKKNEGNAFFTDKGPRKR